MHGLKQYWIGFNLVKGIGPVRLQSLLNVFGDVKTAWEASAVQLQEAGLSSKLIARLLQVRADVSLEQVLQNIHRQKITALTWEDETYPVRLKEIPRSPPVLYVRGEWRGCWPGTG